MLINMFDKRNQQSQTGCRRRVLTRYVHRPAHYCLPGPLVAPPSAPADREYGRLVIHASLMESGLREDASNGFGCKCDITGLCRFLMFLLKGKLWDLNTILSTASASVQSIVVPENPRIPCACPVYIHGWFHPWQCGQ